MTHYDTQKSGLRSSDEVAFLTGRLADGTLLVGMDTVDVKGSIAGGGGSSGTGTPKFFVADASADNVYRYTSSGSAAGFYGADSLVKDVRGIVANAAGDTLWQIDAPTRAVVIQSQNGAIKGYWNAIDVSSPTGIASDGKDIWIVDASSTRVLHYQNAAAKREGVASASSS